MLKAELIAEVERLSKEVKALEWHRDRWKSAQEQNVKLARECKAKIDELAQRVPSRDLPDQYIQVVDPDLIPMHASAEWRLDVYLELDDRRKLLTRIPIFTSEFQEDLHAEDLEKALQLRNHLAGMYCQQFDYDVSIDLRHSVQNLRQY